MPPAPSVSARLVGCSAAGALAAGAVSTEVTTGLEASPTSDVTATAVAFAASAVLTLATVAVVAGSGSADATPRRPGELRRLHHLRPRHEQAGVVELQRRNLGARDDDARAHLGRLPEQLREARGQTDAAMGRRIAGQGSFVQRGTRPGDALHVGHRRVVEIGDVVPALLDHREHAHRRRMARRCPRKSPCLRTARRRRTASRAACRSRR